MTENREKQIPEYKLKLVKELAAKLDGSNTILLASTRGLPSSQFHDIKKKLRGKADVKVAKKSAIIRAIDASKKKGVKDLKENLDADVALFFSEIDAFELSGLLADNQSATKAREGDIALEDITVEPGPTDLVPGPAISELGSVGLKVAVEGGKLAIKQPATLVHKGDAINLKVAGVLAKLGITPMKVGFEPLAAYDSKSDKVYVGIRIDKKKTHEDLVYAIAKSFAFAVGRGYTSKDTIKNIIMKAAMHEKAIASKVDSTTVKEDK